MSLFSLTYSFAGEHYSLFEMRIIEKMISNISNQTIKRFPRELNSKINGSQKYAHNLIYPIKILNSNNIGCRNYYKIKN